MLLSQLIMRVEFYEWAYGHLAESDSEIGVVGEFVVGKALGCLNRARKVNDIFDLRLADGTSIEVKSTSKRRAADKSHAAHYEWKVTDQRTALEGKREVARIWIFLIAQFPEGASERRRFDVFDDRYWQAAVVTGEQMVASGIRNRVTEATLRRFGVSFVPLKNLKARVDALRARLPA